MRIVVAEKMHATGLARLAARAVVQADDELWRRRPVLLGAVAEADGLIVRNQTRVDRELLAAAPGLRVIGRLGVGLDNIDLEAARERGVQVVYARGANAAAVAEFVFAAMLHLARRLGSADADVRGGQWRRERFIGTELAGKTMGIVGFGAIGRRVARLALAFEMNVVVHDPYVAAAGVQVPEDASRVRWTTLEEVVEAADFLTLHVPLTPKTQGLIGPKELARMKPTAYVINTARGGVVDEEALYHALETGRLAGAALDVRAVEPPELPDRWGRLDNVLLTPHMAGWTAEALERVDVSVAEDVLKALAGEPTPAVAV